jgi:hypothetical protein
LSARDSIFSRRVLILWVLASVTIFAISIYFIAHGDADISDPVGPTVESRSALGYAGIADILKRLEMPVIHTKHRSRDRLGEGGVLIVAEPHLSARSLAAADKLLHADAVLLILPKWEGVESKTHSGWISDADLTSFITVQMALDLVDKRGQMVRGPGTDQWDHDELGIRPSLAAPMQYIRSETLHPIVAHGDEILVGEMKRDGRRIFVLSDPDVLSNHGLANPVNAAFAVALIGALRTGDGPVVFDETLNGVVGNGPNLLARLFKLPLLPGTALGIVAVMLLLWATMPRFGAPDPPAPALESGKRGLIDNIAAFVGFAGRRPAIVARFVDATIHDVARQLHAPRELSGAGLIAWLKRVGQARGVEIDFAASAEQANAIAASKRADTALLVSLARNINRWKQEMIDGSGRNKTHR